MDYESRLDISDGIHYVCVKPNSDMHKFVQFDKRIDDEVFIPIDAATYEKIVMSLEYRFTVSSDHLEYDPLIPDQIIRLGVSKPRVFPSVPGEWDGISFNFLS